MNILNYIFISIYYLSSKKTLQKHYKNITKHYFINITKILRKIRIILWIEFTLILLIQWKFDRKKCSRHKKLLSLLI